jgi:membrane protein YdbS with pleckstrin-like domain
MPLIDCPECGKAVSTVAKACPNCGYPVADKLADGTAPTFAPAAGEQELLAEVHPSWWGYFWHLFFFFLIVPPIVAWLQRAALVVRVYRDRITVERGLFNKCYQDFNPRDIRAVDIDQSVWQRMVGIGDVTISTAATEEGSEKLLGIPDPKGLRDLILAQRGNRSND